MTPRLENAITKLYTAFHEGTLNAMDCEHCVVGNLVGHGDWHMQYVYGGRVFNASGIEYPFHPDYSEMELFNIEKAFLTEWAKEGHENGKNKETQFKGICAVVAYLCELDNEPNVMDIQKLFEFDENKKPVHELQFS